MSKALQLDFLAAGLEDSNGSPLSGATARTYESDGSTAKAVWEDRGQAQPSAAGKSEFALDTQGRAEVFGSGIYVVKVWESSKNPDADSPDIIYNDVEYYISADDTWVTIAAYNDNLSTAISSIGASNTTLIIDKPITLTADATVPDNIELKFTRNGIINDDGGGWTLTINGAIDAGLWQIFGSSLTVAGNPKINAVYPEWFGAVGDGATDDTNAFVFTINSAYNFNKKILGTEGKNYGFTTRLGLRTSFNGRNCSFSSLSNSATYDTISNMDDAKTYKATNITFENFSIDGNSSVRGVYLSHGHDCVVRNVSTTNCMASGIFSYGSDRVLVEHCDINGVIYEPPDGTSADGIYLGGSTRSIIKRNKIQDFRRIGIVIESAGSDNSSDPTIQDNLVWNANNCDDSTTQFNAAIWCESTNGGKILNNQCWDIAGNAGQTSGRVNGIVMSASTDQSGSGLYVAQGNYVEATSIKAVRPSGTDKAKVIIKDNILSNPESLITFGAGITVGDNLNDVVISNNFISGIYISASSSAGVNWDIATDSVTSITIDNLVCEDFLNTTNNSNWSHIHGFSGKLRELIIKNTRNVIFVNRGYVTENTFVDNCSLLHGSSNNYGMLAGYGTVRATNTTFTACTSAKGFGASRSFQRLIDVSGSTDSEVSLSACTVDAVDGTFVLENIANGFFTGVAFVNGCNIALNNGTGSNQRFTDCIFDEYDATDGAIYTNYYNSSPADRLFVRGCDFRHSSDVTPLKEKNYTPAVVVLQGNTTTAALLHNFSSVTDTSNNVTGITGN